MSSKSLDIHKLIIFLLIFYILSLIAGCSGETEQFYEGTELLYNPDDKKTLVSIKSGQISDPSVWINKYYGYEDVPTEGSTIIIRPGHQVILTERPSKLVFNNILIMRGGELKIEDKYAKEIIVEGRIIVDGVFTATGSNTIIFKSNKLYLAGFWARENSRVRISGKNLANDLIYRTELNESSQLKIYLTTSRFISQELIGRTAKLRSGLRKDVQYKILSNDERSITIDLNTKGNTHLNDGQQSILAEKSIYNKIYMKSGSIPNNPIPRKTFLNEEVADTSASFVGDWVRFQDSGNMYLIVQASTSASNMDADVITLSSDVKSEDYNKRFDIVHGISSGDELSILDPFIFSIPEEDKVSGERNAVFYAEASDILLNIIEFSHFGTAAREDNSLQPWPKEARGAAITLKKAGSSSGGLTRIMSDLEVSSTLAGASVQIIDSKGIEISRNYIWNVHSRINPNSASEMGHGWVLQNVSQLDFHSNVGINQGDDHIFMTGLSRDVSIIGNKMYSTPTPRGNSTNNAELTLVDGSDHVVIAGNIFLNSDGPVNLVCFSICNDVKVISNVISTSLDPNAAILTLVNANGIISDNLIMNGSIGLAVFGKSSIVARNNVFRNTTVAARNASVFSENIVVGASLVFDSSFGMFSDNIEIKSNILAGADRQYGVSILINDQRVNEKYTHTIYRNTIDSKIADVYRGVPITLALGNSMAIIDRNVILNGSVGIKGRQNLSNNKMMNFYSGIFNLYTGKTEYISDPLDSWLSVAYSGEAVFDKRSGMGYRLESLIFDTFINQGPADFGYTNAGLTGSSLFPIPLVCIVDYLRVSN